MINAEELAICRLRGHKTPLLTPGRGWIQCEKCGIWVRIVTATEEREEEPPEGELDLSVISARILDGVQRRMTELGGGAGNGTA